jgi:hypothetical protein
MKPDKFHITQYAFLMSRNPNEHRGYAATMPKGHAKLPTTTDENVPALSHRAILKNSTPSSISAEIASADIPIQNARLVIWKFAKGAGKALFQQPQTWRDLRLPTNEVGLHGHSAMARSAVIRSCTAQARRRRCSGLPAALTPSSRTQFESAL